MKIFIFMCLFIIITTFLLFYTLLRPIKKKELEEFLQAKDKAEKEYNEISEKIVQSKYKYDSLLAQIDNITEANCLLNQKNLELVNTQKNLENEINTAEKNILNLNNKFNGLLDQYESASDQYIYNIELKYKQYEEEYEQLVTKVEKIKDSLQAASRAFLREKEKENKIDFYKLSISEKEENDIKKLWELREQLSEPSILSKVIWSSYFQKRTNELCLRIIGQKIVTGIYKITNIMTKQCYIGQSVDIEKRFKEHIKCGLGIDASSTNRLYNEMQKYGVWNFTFEVIEQCEKKDLNEKEKFWINTYSSDKYGYNSNKGISK